MDEGIILKHGIKIKTASGAEQTINTLHFGRLQLKHLEKLPADMFSGAWKDMALNPTTLIPLIASMTELDEDAIRQIDVIDDMSNVINEVVQRLEGLQSPEIGKK